MNFLGIDYGQKKIGLAKSAGNVAVPMKILENLGDDDAVLQIQRICLDENIDTIVVGVPFGLEKNQKSRQLSLTRVFIRKLRALKRVTVIEEDERYTSQMAQKMSRALKKGGEDDATSAMLILQSFLDKKNHEDI